MSERPTPITDYEEKRLDHWFNRRRTVYADTARKLELQLAEARENLIDAACMAVVTERQGRYPGAARIADMILNGATMNDTPPAECQTPITDENPPFKSLEDEVFRQIDKIDNLERQLADALAQLRIADEQLALERAALAEANSILRKHNLL